MFDTTEEVKDIDPKEDQQGYIDEYVEAQRNWDIQESIREKCEWKRKYRTFDNLSHIGSEPYMLGDTVYMQLSDDQS